MRVDAAQRAEHRRLGDHAPQPACGVQVDLKALEVAVVDTDGLGAELHGRLHLLGVLHLDEGLHPQGDRVLVQPLEQREVQHLDDQQHRVGARKPRLEDLVLVKDKLLPQDGRPVRHAVQHLAYGPQVVEAALEPLRLRQHRDDARTGERILARLGRGVDVQCEDALRGRGALDLRHEGHVEGRLPETVDEGDEGWGGVEVVGGLEVGGAERGDLFLGRDRGLRAGVDLL